MQLSIVCGLRLKQIVRSDVHDREVQSVLAFYDADAVGAGFQPVPVDFKWNFVDEIGLILLLDSSGVTGVIDQCGQHVVAVGEANAS